MISMKMNDIDTNVTILPPLRDIILENYYNINGILEHYSTLVENMDRHTIGVKRVVSYITNLEPPKHSVAPIYVSKLTRADTNDHYIDATILNPDYVCDYPEGLLPWNEGSEDVEDDCPEGYFNVSWKGYTRQYHFGMTPWADIAYAPIHITTAAFKALEYNMCAVAAEIIYELSFYGYDEQKVREFWDKMMSDNEHLQGDYVYV